MEDKFWPEIINDLKLLLETKSNQDVCIKAGKESDYTEFYAHSLILSCRSQYFRNIFTTDSIERKDGKYIMKKPNITSNSFRNILSFLYIGKVVLDPENGVETLNLLITSNEFGLHKLSQHVADFLIQHQRNFIQKDPIKIIEIVYSHDLFINLREFCLDVICFDPEILLATDKFSYLSEEIVTQLLKREDISSIKEITIWENIIKWGMARNPTIDFDVNKWTKDDTVLMNRTIGKFIPLIQFYEMSAEDFFNRVLPYEELIPRELKQEILRAHMLPGSAKTAPKSFRNCSDDNSIESVSTTEPIRRQSLIKIDSTIITTQHALIFSNWIDRKFNGYQSLKMAPYEFNLLLRGSRDGMDSKKFHKLCDNKGPTILVIRVKNSRQIVGGYNASEWDSSDSTKFSTECFLYSFADYNKLETGTIGRVKSHGCSVRCYKDCGPIFGNYEGGNDLVMKRKNEWKSKPVSYPNINIPKKFNCSDYEVFQVKKKA